MYCSNCGKSMADGAAICLACGFAKGTGNAFCENCGAPRNPNAVVCTSCGCAVASKTGSVGTKSKLIAGLLYTLLGAFGIGDFYLGYTKIGVIKLLITIISMGAFALVSWIWSLIDGIKAFQGEKTDASGHALKD